MPNYRIERTKMVTRVWFITAETEDEALESYINEEPDYERHDSHFCDVDITLESDDSQ